MASRCARAYTTSSVDSVRSSRCASDFRTAPERDTERTRGGWRATVRRSRPRGRDRARAAGRAGGRAGARPGWCSGSGRSGDHGARSREEPPSSPRAGALTDGGPDRRPAGRRAADRGRSARLGGMRSRTFAGVRWSSLIASLVGVVTRAHGQGAPTDAPSGPIRVAIECEVVGRPKTDRDCRARRYSGSLLSHRARAATPVRA